MNHFKFGEGYDCRNIFPSAGKIERLSHTRLQLYANLHFCRAKGANRGWGRTRTPRLKKNFTELEG